MRSAYGAGALVGTAASETIDGLTPYIDALFVPFTDRTTGHDSYAVGRYLRVVPDENEATATVDFNRATNPWCVYDEEFTCPLAPPENWITTAIPAGEKMYRF